MATVVFESFPGVEWAINEKLLILNPDGSFTYQGLPVTVSNLEWNFHISREITDRFGVSDMRMNRDVTRFVYSCITQGWNITEEAMARCLRNHSYMQYRTDGPDFIQRNMPSWQARAKYSKSNVKKIFNAWIADMSDNRSIESVMREILDKADMAQWEVENKRALDRKRKWYFNGEPFVFRLRDYFVDTAPGYIFHWRDGEYVAIDADTLLLPRVRKALAGKIVSWPTCLPEEVFVYETPNGKYALRELVCNDDFVEEGKRMHHCIGGGGYYADCREGEARAFHVAYLPNDRAVARNDNGTLLIGNAHGTWSVKSFSSTANNTPSVGLQKVKDVLLKVIGEAFPTVAQIEIVEE